MRQTLSGTVVSFQEVGWFTRRHELVFPSGGRSRTFSCVRTAAELATKLTRDEL